MEQRELFYLFGVSSNTLWTPVELMGSRGTWAAGLGGEVSFLEPPPPSSSGPWLATSAVRRRGWRRRPSSSRRPRQEGARRMNLTRRRARLHGRHGSLFASASCRWRKEFVRRQGRRPREDEAAPMGRQHMKTPPAGDCVYSMPWIFRGGSARDALTCKFAISSVFAWYC